jgi:hypothetical protein
MNFLRSLYTLNARLYLGKGVLNSLYEIQFEIKKTWIPMIRVVDLLTQDVMTPSVLKMY